MYAPVSADISPDVEEAGVTDVDRKELEVLRVTTSIISCHCCFVCAYFCRNWKVPCPRNLMATKISCAKLYSISRSCSLSSPA
jgi:hypothetical protein